MLSRVWQHASAGGVLFPVIYHGRDSGRWSAPVHRVASRSAHIAVGAGHGRDQARGLRIWGPGREPPSRAACVRPCRHNRSVGACLIVEGGTSRTGAKRAGEYDGLTGLPEANAGSPGPRQRSPPAWSTRFRAPGCGSCPTGTARRSPPLSRPICTAPSQEAAWQALTDFSESDMGVKYPQTVTTCQRAWERFTPFLDFPPMLRRVIYTTNSIETASYQLRKVTDEPRPLPFR